MQKYLNETRTQILFFFVEDVGERDFAMLEVVSNEIEIDSRQPFVF